MREDMFKVIVERPRRMRSSASKTKIRYERTGTRRCVTGKRIAYEHNGYTKFLNENLAPLKRYLFKQKGRQWNDVFSEICANLDTGSTVKMHVREHIDDFVMRKVRIDADGQYWGASHWGAPQSVAHWWPELYVDPIDGTLKATADLREQQGVRKWHYNRPDVLYRRALDPFIRKLGDRFFFMQFNGIWYSVMIKTRGETSVPAPYAVFECLKTAGRSDSELWELVSKTQLSKKQFKSNGLKNGTGGSYE